MVLIIAIVLGTIASSAASSPNSDSKMCVYSPEYPDAYIISGRSDMRTIDGKLAEGVSATVFVEEEYDTDEQGNRIVVSSRLLSYEEVKAIGEDNFTDLSKERENISVQDTRNDSSGNARGKLTLSFSKTQEIEGNSVSCYLYGRADWSAGYALFSGSTNPSFGNDYMGVVWSGGFTTNYQNIISHCSVSGHTPPVQGLCESVPNAGRVWEFSEYWVQDVGPYSFAVYLSDIQEFLTLYKQNMTGGGNTAEAVLKYIHTYGSASGSIQIEATPTGIGAGFTLSNVLNQWSLVCTLTGIPY